LIKPTYLGDCGAFREPVRIPSSQGGKKLITIFFRSLIGYNPVPEEPIYQNIYLVFDD
jgi:hypothetical protein